MSAAAPGRERVGSDALLWLALALAFSPVALDLLRHATSEPWARYALLFPLLFALAARRGEPGVPRRGGLWWIAAALALELLAAFAGAIRWARPALALAVLGMCRRAGIGSARAQALLLWTVPIPAFLALAGSRELRAVLTPLAAALLQGLGLDVALADGALRLGGQGVGVRPARELWALAPLLAGLGWYDATLQRAPLGRAFAASLGLALLALPIEFLALCLGVGAAALAGPQTAQAGLRHAPALGVAAAGVAIAEWRWRRRRSGR